MNPSAAATLSFPIPISISFPTNIKSRCNYAGNPPSLKLKASVSTSNFPLASKIIVKNLGYSVSETSLQNEFSNFGEIAEVKLVKDEVTKRSKAYAFIQYSCQDDAILAMENMDHKMFDGRVIYVELAKPGKGSFGGYPKASGPPKEITDCWY
ncbi:glycine-rich RNA-binding protein 4, mitochondrial [Euphorbia lathyris]|uniref:glycine-rich RNA-binding protein 4, mitochondrial n=1 Tax=Euphorbia lathyris TaxID=212925 RepID=UPI003313532F